MRAWREAIYACLTPSMAVTAGWRNASGKRDNVHVRTVGPTSLTRAGGGPMKIWSMALTIHRNLTEVSANIPAKWWRGWRGRGHEVRVVVLRRRTTRSGRSLSAIPRAYRRGKRAKDAESETPAGNIAETALHPKTTSGESGIEQFFSH